MNIALIICVALVALGAVMGIKNGFVKTVFALGSTIVAIILTIWLSPMVANMMRNNETIMTAITEKVEENLAEDDASAKESGKDGSSEDADKKKSGKGKKEEGSDYINGLDIPDFLKENLNENNNDAVYKALEVEKENIKHYASVYIASIIVKALAFIVTFIVISLLLWLICHLLNVVAKLPVLNFLNRVLGCAAGIAEGLVIIWLLFVLVAAMAQTTLGMSVLKMIGDSKVLLFLYEHNLITYCLGLL